MTDADPRDEMDRGADVIRLPSSINYGQNEAMAEFDEAPVRSNPTYDSCRHWRTWIDGPQRRVTCRDCEAELDPYEVLEKLARAHASLIATARRYRAEIQTTSKSLAKLERQERNAKARVKRARDWLRENAGRAWADLASDDDLFTMEQGSDPTRDADRIEF